MKKKRKKCTPSIFLFLMELIDLANKRVNYYLHKSYVEGHALT